MKDFIVGLLLIVVAVGFIYGSYWLAKTVSYSVFYEDMVIDTVREVVKPSCLVAE